LAAFCACCGVEITLKPEACPRCGVPRHGMSPQPYLLSTLDDSSQSRRSLGCLPEVAIGFLSRREDIADRRADFAGESGPLTVESEADLGGSGITSEAIQNPSLIPRSAKRDTL
jgi:hypothetical protein